MPIERKAPWRRLYVERAMFVIGEQETGKSTQLRSIFCDHRFGTDGDVPTASRLRGSYSLSNERLLHLRLTSPHERNESVREWLAKARKGMGEGRRCYAAPLQPWKSRRMPDAAIAIRRFAQMFRPERVRAVVLDPAQDDPKERRTTKDLRESLAGVKGLEVIRIDAGMREANGVILADFFDFT